MGVTGVSLWADVDAPSRARHALEDVGSGLPVEVLERGELLISEAVSNGVRHGSTSTGDLIEVSVDIDADRVRVEVTDRTILASPLIPRGLGTATNGHGLGLFLIDRMADRWGTEALDEGKIVWFELDLLDP